MYTMIIFHNSKPVFFIFLFVLSFSAYASTGICELYAQNQKMLFSKLEPPNSSKLVPFTKEEKKAFSRIENEIKKNNKKRTFSNINKLSDLEKEMTTNSEGLLIFIDQEKNWLSDIFNSHIQSDEIKENIRKKYKLIHINIDKNMYFNNEKLIIEIFKKLNINNPPMVLKYDSSGKETGRLFQCVSKNEFILWLR